MKRNSESVNQRVKSEIRRIFRNREEMPLYRLRAELVLRLGVKLRVDFLVANMLGMKGFLVDCEHYMVWKVK